jgi:hypothetical protein
MFLKIYSLSTFAVLATGCFETAWAQVPVFISGEVIEKGSDKHLPGAVITLAGERIGTKADPRGYFRINMMKERQNDTLEVLVAGYQAQRIAVDRSAASGWVTAEMVKKAAPLTRDPTANAAAEARVVILGAKASKKSDGMMQGYPGTQYAVWLKNDGQAGVLKSVGYFIDALGFPSEPFRVRIYKALPGGKGPGEELLTEKIVVSAPKGGQWFNVDISKYYLTIPKDGIFVAMEWLVAGESFVATDSKEEYTPYGQILAPTYEFKENLTWSYTVGKQWAPLTTFDKTRIMNAMIRAEATVF